MPRFLSCLSSSEAPAAQYDQLLPGPGGDKVDPSCIFCSASRETGFNVVYEDDKLVAFHDRTPRARTHILIIPRAHAASSVRQLTPQQLPLLRSMITLAHTLVPPNPPPKLGFHIPPFSSVPHLHLHVFSGPHTFIGRFKYPVTSHKSGKGYGWFVTADQVERALESGGKITLGRS
ncbi:hypothetical protein IAT38_007790 [Cryptococcus sp. DSM 104549]